MNKHFLSFADSGCIGPETFFHVCVDKPAPLFRAEYDMHYVLKIGVRQCVTPPGFAFYTTPFPALTRWANFLPRLRRCAMEDPRFLDGLWMTVADPGK